MMKADAYFRNKEISMYHICKKLKKKNISPSLNASKVVENKSFLKTVKPFLSDKTISLEKITFIDNGEFITELLRQGATTLMMNL